jgi:23S rRNA A2030 N6-methylase RlmJ
MEEDIASIIEQALGVFPGSRLVAEGIVRAIADAGFKIVPMNSTELRRQATKRKGEGAQKAGGYARAQALTPERRREIAQRAAQTRWSNE